MDDMTFWTTDWVMTSNEVGSMTIKFENVQPVVEAEQAPLEQSRDFGREFARLQKKLNAISRAIGQGFDEEMKSGDDAHDD